MAVMFRDHDVIEQSERQLTTSHVHRKKVVLHQEKILTSTLAAEQYFYHPHSSTSKKDIRKATLIDASKPPPIERPCSAPLIRKYVRIKINFKQ
jgi:hypothetical protein